MTLRDVNPPEALRLSTLKKVFPNTHWHPQCSGTSIPPDVVDYVKEHLSSQDAAVSLEESLIDGPNMHAPPYEPPHVLEEGAFLDLTEVEFILRRLRTKKNVILQGGASLGKCC